MQLVQNQIIYADKTEMFVYDLATLKNRKITKEEYVTILFGKSNFQLRKLLGQANYITQYRIYSAFYQKNDLWIYTREGKLIEEKKDFFEGFTPYGIALNEETRDVWVATGAGQVVFSKNTETDKVITEIGLAYDDTQSPILYPEDIFIYENQVFVSEMGNKRVLKINLNTLEQEVYLSFEERVWSFQKNEFTEIVLLDSGIYYQKNNKWILVEN